jgi:Na+(H+)/acetate symporter ActP
MPQLTAYLLPAAGTLLLALALVAIFARSSTPAAHANGSGEMHPVGGGLALAGLFALAAMAVLPGLVHQHGFDALIPLSGVAGGLLLLLILVGPALDRSGAATLPSLVGQRFGRLARALTLLVSLLATAGLLLGVCAAAIALTTRFFHVTVGPAALALAAAILLLALPGGLKSVLSGSRLVAALTGLALMGTLAILCTALLGNPIPQLAYGGTVQNIRPAEMALIESGAVDFGVFKPFLREFLTVDRLNWALLAICLTGAIAALPPLVHATGAFAAGTARRGIAWALTFVVIAFTAIPALAAIARLETYRAVASSATFAELPLWIRRASELGAVEIHGTSIALVETVAQDVAAGAASIDALAAAFADRGSSAETAWQRLNPAVQDAVLDLARKFNSAPGLPLDDRWTPYVDTVVMAAAAAAGNTSGKPDLAALALDPHLLVIAAPHAAGLPGIVTAVMLALGLAAAVILAAALVATLATQLVCDGTGAIFGREPSPGTEIVLIRLVASTLALAVTLAAALIPVSADVIFVISLTLVASALLPAIVLTLWIPRATAAGLATAIVCGLVVGTYYLAGTAIYSVAFYESWPGLSSAGPEAFAEYEEARELWMAAEGDERAAAYADLAARTMGSFWSPGLANWFGIAPAAAPILAVPLALLAGLLVSLVMGRRRQTSSSADGPAAQPAPP